MQGGQQDSSAAHIAGNQGPHTTVPLPASPLLQEDPVHCQCCVHGDYYSQCTHHYHPRFMCTTKQSMQTIFSYKISWSGWFRMFVQLEHWKSAREMLDAAVWNHDGYSGCTTWKLVDTMVSRCFQTVCAVVPKVTTVLPVLLGSSTHWLLTKQFTHVTAISRMASLQGRIEWQSFRTRLPYGYGGCTAWKLVGVIVSRCLCVFFFWVTMVLPLLSKPSTHWLLTEHFTRVTAISRMACL